MDVGAGELTLSFGRDVVNAKFDDGQLYVNLCGWNTQTTKARLNALSGVSVHNVKGEPCLNGVPMPVNGWVKVPMESQFI